jgi:hypothetical protein
MIFDKVNEDTYKAIDNTGRSGYVNEKHIGIFFFIYFETKFNFKTRFHN